MSAKWLLNASAISPGEVKTWFPGYFGNEYKMAEQSLHSCHEEEIRELLTKKLKKKQEQQEDNTTDYICYS